MTTRWGLVLAGVSMAALAVVPAAKASIKDGKGGGECVPADGTICVPPTKTPTPTPTGGGSTGGGGTGGGGTGGGGTGGGGTGGGGGSPPIVGDVPTPGVPGWNTGDQGGNGTGTGGTGGGGNEQECNDTTSTCKSGDNPVFKDTCTKCSIKKKTSCDTCRKDDKDRSSVIAAEKNKCTADAHKEASLQCHLGMLPTGVSINPAKTVKAQKCLDENGGKWSRWCPSVVDSTSPCGGDEIWDHISGDLPEPGSIQCSHTPEWNACVNSWTGNGNAGSAGGLRGLINQFWGIDLGSSISIKETFTIDLDGSDAIYVWAKGDGTIAKCGLIAAARQTASTDTTLSCRNGVNATFTGGVACTK